jgi:uncharacterized protein (TIGR02453 family)
MASMSQPFNGFGPTIQFLQELTPNNNREWFTANKERYQAEYMAPAQAFVEAMEGPLAAISPGIHADPRASGGSIMRIYRDVRFAKDKTPYHNYLRFIFWLGEGKKTELPSFFFRIDPDGAGLFAGLHIFPKDTLAAFRQAVDDEKKAATLAQAVAQVRAAGEYEVGGDKYVRVPRGYPADHPRAEMLRYKGLWAKSPPIPDEVLTSPELINVCIQHCRNTASLVAWLGGVL